MTAEWQLCGHRHLCQATDGQVSWTVAWPVDPAITGRIETGR
jgi:hypothetical protein